MRFSLQQLNSASEEYKLQLASAENKSDSVFQCFVQYFTYDLAEGIMI